MIERVNSKEYWEARFANDWVEKEGPMQSTYFARLALGAFPGWLKNQIQRDDLSLCDWGCGMGDGTSVINQGLSVSVTGVDFSEEAIRSATRKYSKDGVDFVAEDWLSQGAKSLHQYDVVFSSNTLEHFSDPCSVFEVIAARARKHVVLLLPFEEDPLARHEEHFVSFFDSSFPITKGEWYITYACVIDKSRIDSNYWGGSQILLVYSKFSEMCNVESTLADFGVAEDVQRGGWNVASMPEFERLAAEVQLLNSSIGSHFSGFADLQDHAHKVVESTLIGLGEAINNSHVALTEKIGIQQALSPEQIGLLRIGLREDLAPDFSAIESSIAKEQDLREKLEAVNLKLANKEHQMSVDRAEFQQELEMAKRAAADKGRELSGVRDDLERQLEAARLAVTEKQRELSEVRDDFERQLEEARLAAADKARELFGARDDFERQLEAASLAATQKQRELSEVRGELEYELEVARRAAAGSQRELSEVRDDFERQLEAASLAATQKQRELSEVRDDFERQLEEARLAAADKARELFGARDDFERQLEAASLAATQKQRELSDVRGELEYQLEVARRAAAGSQRELSEVRDDFERQLEAARRAVADKGRELHSVRDDLGNQLEAARLAAAQKQRELSVVRGELERQLETAKRAAAEKQRELSDAHGGFERQLEAAKLAAAYEVGELSNSCADLEQRLEVMECALAEKVADLVRVRASLEDRIHEAAAKESTLFDNIQQLRQRNFHLVEVAARYNRLVESRTWRWMAPLRKLSARLERRPLEPMYLAPAQLVTHSAGANDIAGAVPTMWVDAKTLGQGIDTASEFSRANLVLAEPEPGVPDVFVWSVIDWHFRTQRPQHLARALANAGHRVFYISNNFVDSASAGFAVEALDDNGRLFQINLHVIGAPPIYFDMPTHEQAEAIRASLGALLAQTHTSRAFSLVQHPFWMDAARSLPNMQLVYDCMDHHGGFADNAASVLAAEKQLVANSDLVIVTSQWLMDELSGDARSTAMIRNATEFAHFCDPPVEIFRDSEGRQVVGYYGAIADWFDVELVRHAAKRYPDVLFVLVGADTVGAEGQLSGLTNVMFVGEVPYAQLPYWLHGFDVCLLPFQVIELTLATNPVKVYEYLSAGKPVVSVDLPEMTQFDGLVELARTPDEFSGAIGEQLRRLRSEDNTDTIKARQAFAARQTWDHRASDLDSALAGISEPRVSVVVLCYNNVDYTRACLDSLEKHSDYPNLEIIAVDNASSDDTPIMLKEWAAAAPNRKHITNDDNLGFSGGNNVGLAAATGDYLVILNNDTYVTPGWVRGLVNHLRRNPQAGLVGPVTNNIGNEAKIEIAYANMEEMIEAAGDYTRKHAGIAFPMVTAAFFCVMLTRKAYETVGPMDEAFGVGFFEDDDYCRRLEKAGYGVLCADDVFVHHHLSASFDALGAERKLELFKVNKEIYENKWGDWIPHRYRGKG